MLLLHRKNLRFAMFSRQLPVQHHLYPCLEMHSKPMALLNPHNYSAGHIGNNNYKVSTNLSYGQQSSILGQHASLTGYGSQLPHGSMPYGHHPSTSGIISNYSNLVFSKSRIQSWIIDTGATDHMCGTNIHLTNLQPCHPTRVYIPNSNSPLVTNVLQLLNFHLNP